MSVSTKISSDAIVAGTELGVDPTFLAGRIALRPLEYAAVGKKLGHYMVSQLSGAIAATPTALDPHASIRWAPSDGTSYLVLLRLRVGWSVISAITTTVRMAYQASIARGFTVDFTTASTAINMATVSNTQKMYAGMGASLMGTSGPRIATTTVMSGQTYTLDNAPFAIQNWNPQQILTGTVSLPAGSAGPVKTLYECTADGQHPVVLSNNEGVALQLVHTGWASGTVSLYTEWTWAEVVVF